MYHQFDPADPRFVRACACSRPLKGPTAWSPSSPAALNSTSYCTLGNASTASTASTASSAAVPTLTQTSAPSTICAVKEKDDEREDGPRVASNLEKYALTALQRLFVGKSFQKVRPSWLRNPRSNRLCELDFYNDELKLGVEVQGLQHYVYPNHWHKTRVDFQEQVFRDHIKVDLCQQMGVTLLHIPFTVTANKVEQYIRDEVARVTESSSLLHKHMSRPSNL